MTPRQRVLYGIVMGLAVLVTAEVLGVGSLGLNVAFAVAMALFAMLAVTVAARLSRRRDGGGRLGKEDR